jgi:ACR3 family arsenite transporter
MTATAPVLRRLSTLDRFLPLWIFSAMAAGLLLGRAVPDLGAALDRVQVAGVSVPIAIGLLWMMYPVLAKVRYETIGSHVRDTKLLGTSLLFNWVLGPLVMLALAWLFLPDMPEYRNGLILIGLARCIAMVLIWNSLASGSGELAAVLVALNSLFQILTYSFLAWLFLGVLPAWFGAETAVVDVSMWEIAKSVLIFLGIPLLAGYLTRRLLVARRGAAWYDGIFMPKFGPTALLGLLYTIVLMFAMQGDRIIQLPLDVLRIALLRLRLPGDGLALVHRGREQLRARDRRGRRDVRHRLRGSARCGGGAAGGGAGADRIGVRVAVGGAPILRIRARHGDGRRACQCGASNDMS